MSVSSRSSNGKFLVPRFRKLINPMHPIIETLLRHLLGEFERGKLSFVFDNGREVIFNSAGEGPVALIEVHSLKGLRRLVSGGYMGLAEGYMAGEWSSPSLPELFAFGTANQSLLDKRLSGGILIGLINKTSHIFRRNTREGSRRNISNHYDLGNAFFSEWLDPSLTYSSAIFNNTGQQTLKNAQENKCLRIINELGIKENDHILEIGCGWGGFAEYTARKTGAHITAITISKEQYEYSLRRIENSGLNNRVDILLQDYRDIEGEFDKIVSIEMLEAVGEAYWPEYFQTLSNHLTKDGKAMIQAITIRDDQYFDYRRTVDFIQKYIFPGGMLICPTKINELSLAADLEVTNDYMMGESYAKTLDLWRESFLENWKKIADLGFDERFKRMWNYYLVYTSAGFKAGEIDVGQFCLTKT